ncbi:Zinc finger protein 800, partial [Frankliniella fusca]
ERKMGAKTGAKAGRPFKHNGKAKVQEKEEEPPKGPDFSLLRKPVEISVTGLSELVRVFENSPPELHHLLSYECDVVYECKVCRNLFRSLANFISHKRVYCTQLHGNSQNSFFKSNKRVNDTTVIVEPEVVRTTRAREHWRTSDVGGPGDVKEVYEPKTRNGLAEPAPFRITIKKDLTSIVEKLMQKNSTQTLNDTASNLSSNSEFYDDVSKELTQRRKEARQQTIHLQPIENTSYGVFQTVVQTPGSSELIKSQVQDLHRIISDTEAVLGPDGRVVENGTPHSNIFYHDDRRKKVKTFDGEEYNGPPVTAPESEVELYCNLCKEHFLSYKSLNHHMKSLHMTFRTFYPCPCCKLPLSNSWSVYRHLLKVHRKTNEQIRKLREKVIKRSFKREVLQSGAQKLSKSNVSENPLCPSELIYDTNHKPIPLNEEDTYKQWFGHHEDGFGQCCGVCGRRFDRRAALLAHSQSCLKQSSAKQNLSAPGRTPVQTEKPSTAGRQTQNSKAAASPGPLSPVVSALRSTTALPVLPLHLQDKQPTPTKKIEIQIRRDYGKTSINNSECRTRTPSTSRSEDGAASVSRSEDGTTSGSSETEASGHSEKRLELSKDHDNQLSEMERSKLNHKSGRRLSSASQITHVNESDPPVKRRVGRPRKHRPEVVHVNGSNEISHPVLISDGSDDSNDAKEKPLRNESKKRKAEEALVSVEDESEDDNNRWLESKNIEGGSLSQNDHATSNSASKRKLLCLLCHKKFKSPFDLRKHLSTVHISYNRFRCLMCEFRCFSKADCISHALRLHLDPWEKEKAIAMVQDMQMDAGGSTDAHPCDDQIDSGDSESAISDPDVRFETPDKSDDSSPDDLPNINQVVHEGPSIEGVGEIIGVA